jgi:hypothetical protein
MRMRMTTKTKNPRRQPRIMVSLNLLPISTVQVQMKNIRRTLGQKKIISPSQMEIYPIMMMLQ